MRNGLGKQKLPEAVRTSPLPHSPIPSIRLTRLRAVGTRDEVVPTTAGAVGAGRDVRAKRSRIEPAWLCRGVAARGERQQRGGGCGKE